MKVCVIIPVYNHGETLADTLENLAAYGLPTIIIDDGSDDHCKEIIAGLLSGPNLSLITLARNQGKGAAVQAGLREAWKQGFTHAAQVDADGQHDLDDLGTLLDAARENPGALISGDPKFDDSAPSSRLYGRIITLFWVRIETLSLSITDAMCGFRVYPLEPCIQLMEKRDLGKRMDFDIEITVRLYWLGVPFIPIPTRVIYPDGGTSHFRVLHDNWCITKMHTRLFFGMLLRLPLLIGRKFGVGKHHWSTLEERGATLGMKFMFACYKFFGRGVFRIVLFPVMTYYFLTSGDARRASRQFLDRVQEMRAKNTGQPMRRLNGFRHFLQFGEAILDKAALWADLRSKKEVAYIRPEIYQDISNSKRGGVFIGSHLGNLEALRAFGGVGKKLTVHALVFVRRSARFMKFMAEASPRAVENIIQVDTLGPESVIRMRAAIAKGEWIAVVADRTSATQQGRSKRCDFLGYPAQFPEGPFILAALLECPVYFVFCLEKGGRYEVHLEKLSDRITLPRATRRQELQRIVELFANRLERQCLEYPYQWYNFFDFWQKPDTK